MKEPRYIAHQYERDDTSGIVKTNRSVCGITDAELPPFNTTYYFLARILRMHPEFTPCPVCSKKAYDHISDEHGPSVMEVVVRRRQSWWRRFVNLFHWRDNGSSED